MYINRSLYLYIFVISEVLLSDLNMVLRLMFINYACLMAVPSTLT